MTTARVVPARPRYEAIGPARLDQLARRYPIPVDLLPSMRLFAKVLPFRVNEYVLEELIDWSDVPADPIFQLVFPAEGMLPAATERALAATESTGNQRQLASLVKSIRADLNPHPSAQRELNVPALDGHQLAGLQHKYVQTVLYFPQHGQTCHAYCTYCFRWAQFVGDSDLRFAATTPDLLVKYLGEHPEVSDVLVTGGDPMIMSTERLRQHLEPLLAVDTVRTIRIGTKSVAYWPQRFVSDGDSDDLLELFEEIVATGRNLVVMAHYSHHRELQTPLARRAVQRIHASGARMFGQSPVIAHVNDDVDTLTELWLAEFDAGVVPYYLFIARDTGPHDYFKVPLVRAQALYAEAYRQLPGLARTIRGPVMSSTPGKVVIDGCAEVAGAQVLALRFLQARNSELVGRPFFARVDPQASWLDELQVLPSTPTDIRAAVQGPDPVSEYPE